MRLAVRQLLLRRQNPARGTGHEPRRDQCGHGRNRQRDQEPRLMVDEASFHAPRGRRREIATDTGMNAAAIAPPAMRVKSKSGSLTRHSKHPTHAPPRTRAHDKIIQHHPCTSDREPAATISAEKITRRSVEVGFDSSLNLTLSPPCSIMQL